MKNTGVIFLLTIIQLCNGGLSAQEKHISKAQQPKVLIGLVVDQMRWDYLYRFQHHYGNGGFKRLMTEGFNYENAFIPYASSVTATGHASIYTGAYPFFHGIVGNEWVDRTTGKYVYCTDDSTVVGVGGTSKQGMMSPANLLSTTIGDELKFSNNFQSRIFGISLKDRGGIFPAGRTGDAAYWLEDSSGNWITSTWYMDQLPVWVRNFNERRTIDSMMREGWNLAKPVSAYQLYRSDENDFEVPISQSNTTHFPHQLNSFIRKNYNPFRSTPMGNTFTLNFAKSLIKEEQLGKGDFTDILCISLSSTDYIGHKFGTHSLEIEDTYIRLDADLAAFLLFLDESIGKGNYTLFLSADHGAPPSPDFLKTKKVNAGNINNYALTRVIASHLEKKFGVAGLVTHYFDYQFYLNTALIKSKGLKRSDVSKAIIDYLNEKPEVEMAFDYADFNTTILPQSVRDMFAKGYHPKRSGDIQVILQP
ncbi:MAG: alkaline phosphatase family protein, partial [Chitinophagaceae bacterium]